MTNTGGRPAIGGAVHIRLGGLVDDIDRLAARHDLTRAETVRQLIGFGLTEAPEWWPGDRVRIPAAHVPDDWATTGEISVNDGQAATVELDDGHFREIPLDELSGETAPLDGAHTVQADQATAQWLTTGAMGSLLAANGRTAEDAGGGRVRLGEGAAAFLAEVNGEHEDGHVEITDDGTALLWVEGEPYTLTPA